MNTPSEICRLVNERLAAFVCRVIKPTLDRSLLSTEGPEYIRKIDVERVVRERSPLFSEEEIAATFPTDHLRRVAVTMLGPCSVLADLPINTLSAAHPDGRLAKLARDCRSAAVYREPPHRPGDEFDELVGLLLSTGRLRPVS